MNFEAIIVIGSVMLIIGVVLLIPGLWWARRKIIRLPENSQARKKVTLFGFIYFTVFITLLMSVLSLKFLAPELTSAQRIVILAAVFLVGIMGEKIVNRLGFKLIE